MPEIRSLDLFRKELALIRKFRELTQQTPQAKEEENLAPLMVLFAQREKILEEISRCQKRIEKTQPFLSRDPDANEIAKIIEEIRSVHREITALDREIGHRLQLEKDQVRQKMEQFGHGHRALKGYSSPRVRIPRYCDKKG